MSVVLSHVVSLSRLVNALYALVFACAALGLAADPRRPDVSWSRNLLKMITSLSLYIRKH